MKKLITLQAFIFCVACNTATPENYFDIAVLNTNMMHGFADEGLQRELDNPTVKLVEGSTNQTAPMKRQEVIDGKIKFIEPNFEKVKKLKETGDTKDMLQASRALYEYVLPVYRNEYRQLAKLYDDGAPGEQIRSLAQIIHDKYEPGFEKLYTRLIETAKPFASKHNIKVNWDINTSPQ